MGIQVARPARALVTEWLFIHAAEAAGTRGGGRRVLSCCRPPGTHSGKNTAAAIWKTSRRPCGRPSGLTQKRMLKMKLEGGRRTALCGEHGLEMFDRVQQWIWLCAGRRRLFAAKPRAPVVQPPAQSATEAIHRLQRKRQAQLVRRHLAGKTGQQFQEPEPHQRSGHGVTRQNLSQKNGKRAPATTAPPAIGTKHPLSAHPLPTGLGAIVAAQETVPVQLFRSLAAWTALLLEGKSVSFSAGSSRAK